MTNPVSTYEIKRSFRAPLGFVYAWCTDYTKADRKLQGDPGSRQIIRKTSRTAVYEDLNETPHGWMWSRQTVTLQPPNRWHAVAAGNYRTWNLDYSLRELPDGRTEFTMHGERRATPLGVKNPPKAVLEKELQVMWRNLGKALERDYRAGRPKGPR
ncbi:MAG: SRPBCC family protein [Thermoplasmata archaeon]